MTSARTSSALIALGALCFLVVGAALVLRAAGIGGLTPEQMTIVASLAMMSVAVGASMRRR